MRRKLGIPGDCLIALEARIEPHRLQENRATGLGRYIDGSVLPVRRLYRIVNDGSMSAMQIEEAHSQSLKLIAPALRAYGDLAPRSLSVLPIARACQASCRFCFSESSASLEQVPHALDLDRVRSLCERAREAGAERFVITGGGEPGLLPHGQMLELIHLGRTHFGKVVLITNAVHLARREEGDRLRMLADYGAAGLSVLAVSRHHHVAAANRSIMGLDTRTERVVESWRGGRGSWPGLRLRLVCVLQKGAIEDLESVREYLRWAQAGGVEEVCFKELYVSTMLESAYHAAPENQWSLANQVPLSLVTQYCSEAGLGTSARLPWGAPVLAGVHEGKPLRVAAYTEPSLFWERSIGIARSWNIMADGSVLVSLEDPLSLLPTDATLR